MAVIKIACVQMQVTADVAHNVAKIVEGLHKSADLNADIAVFPECAISGYPPIHHKTPSDVDFTTIAEANDEVCRAARDAGIWAVVGSIVNSPDGMLNTALLIDSEGNIEGRQDKLHMFGKDADFFIPGQTLEVFTVKGVRLGLSVCYDVRFPEAYRIMREEGVELFIVILNGCDFKSWKIPVLEGTFRCRAAENTAFVAAVNAAGPGQMCVSRICDPRGVDLAVAQVDTEQIITAELDTDSTGKGCYFDRRMDLFDITLMD